MFLRFPVIYGLGSPEAYLRHVAFAGKGQAFAVKTLLAVWSKFL